ncbi:MAG: hypothetical protein WCX17_04320 [Parcubacteria group bacterium]|jgi:hypothetical protein
MHFLNRKLKIFSAIIIFVIMGGFLLFTGIRHARAATSAENWAMNYSRFVLSGFGIGDMLGLYNPADIIYDQTSGSPPGTSAETFNNGCKLTLNPSTWVTCLLLAVLDFVGWIMSIAALIFAWAADAKNLTAVINGPAVYNAWKIIRDFLNMAFILVLVYTAFTIIFQVDSTNKKRILTVVLMALLVNFSFPIARFIIDVGNSMMYTIFNNLFDGVKDPSAIYASITGKAQLGPIIHPADPTISSLLASIVFVAILAVTLLMMSVLFVIRIVALALVIIFSPIAFVGVAVPSMESKAGQWWDYLFKYTFFGPIMAFMLYIAITLMNTIIPVSVGATTANEQPILVAMSTFAIPIIVLWIGMGFAQKMGIEGADFVTKQGKGALAWAGKKFSGYNAIKRQYEGFNKQRKARQDEKDKNTYGGSLGKRLNKMQDSLHGAFTTKDAATKKAKHSVIPGAKSAWERAERMRQAETIKDVKDKSEDLKGAKIETLSVEVNNSFDAAGTVKGKITKDQAGSAQAFMNKQGDDRKTFVEEAITTYGGAPIANMMAGAPANIQQAAAVVAGAPLASPPFPPPPSYQDALRQITSFINRKSEEVVTQYTK